MKYLILSTEKVVNVGICWHIHDIANFGGLGLYDMFIPHF